MANIYEELAAYADMIVVPGLTVGKLVYANAMTLYSTAGFNVASGAVVANTKLDLYQVQIGESGQGFTTAVTLGQTNSRFSKGTAPKNQVFIATHAGFEIFGCSSLDPTSALQENMLPPEVIFALADQFSWDLNIGRGQTRTIGTLLEYGASSGAWAASQEAISAGSLYGTVGQLGLPGGAMKRLATPLIFPPQIPVEISAKCGNGFTLINQGVNAALTDNSLGTPIATTNICVRQHLRGFLMTTPV